MRIDHQLANKDFYKPNWKVKHLFVGTFNPSGGEEVNYYYGRETNKTWQLISKIFKDEFNVTDPEAFFKKLKAHGIACMDLIHSVEAPSEQTAKILGKGYKDSAIINKKVVRQYNDTTIQKIIKDNPGVNVYSTWGKGPSLKEWKGKVAIVKNMINLVSPSMAAKVPKGSEKFDYMLADWSAKIKLTN